MMIALAATDLSKSYQKISALKAFSLTVASGELFALVGPDGAGKTTFIRILCGLLRPDSGDVEIAGHSVTTEHDRIKTLLGYMPQHFSLYLDLSVEENLTFYAGIYDLTGKAFRDKRDYLYEFSNLAPFANRRASALSGGMKQKLALSCALLHDPKVLILDEPTTGVDPLSRRQFWDILLRLKQDGVTIVVSTPYMDEVARADRACFVFSGKKLTEGTPTELAEQFHGQIFFLDRVLSQQSLKTLHAVEGLAIRRFGSGMHVQIGPHSKIEQFSNPLQQIGISLNELSPAAADLEDRFVQLVEELS